ncbi:Z-DNA-binding protein 1 [Pyxicephalus adspersus]|uniref:Z-DNA-binding protein 1 n=1 Tax=Pyxicephalus adspersus TaxID=30357 RepID=UPI003B5AEC17
MEEAAWNSLQQRQSEQREQSRTEKKNHELTEQQKRIYEFLQQKKPQKALTIAKAVGKSYARDINPDLYKMQGWNLLDCSQDKLWSIKTERPASENKSEAEHPNWNRPTSIFLLSDQQKKIYTLLENNKPMKAKDIAKKLGKNTAKDVNSDLYAMGKINLLTHNKEHNYWTVKCQIVTECKDGNKGRTLITERQYRMDSSGAEYFRRGEL